MRLVTVDTGSTGNCYLLQRDNDRFIALDCGVHWKRVMVAAKFRPYDIELALVTHVHSDHCKYAKDFEGNGIEIINTENTEPNTVLKKGDVTIIPFEVPHDVKCYGYLICVDGHRIVYMTDFGYCKYTFRTWNIDTWIIACNYTEAPNHDEVKFSHVVFGHSSLNTVKQIIEVNKGPAMKNIVLCHYSEDSDTARMINEVQEVAGDDVTVSLARKGERIEL